MKLIATAAVGAAIAIALQQPTEAQDRTQAVPDNIRVEEGHRPFLQAHAYGTQNYMCLPKGSTLEWTPVGPQATLYTQDIQQVTTHFLSRNPEEGGTTRPTWHHSRDSSTIWAEPIETSIDPEFVAPDAIAWLKLRVVGRADGPLANGVLTKTMFIQRINTVGGKAPATGCSDWGQVGNRQFVPYETDYIFFKRSDTDGQ
jgi:hypothetical protein